MNSKLAILGGTLIAVVGVVLALRLWHVTGAGTKPGGKGEAALEMHAASLSRFLSLKPGMSERTVRGVLGTQLFSECLFNDRGAQVRIFSPYVAPDGRTSRKYWQTDWCYLWLIFRQSQLTKVVEPVPVARHEYPYEGTTATRRTLLPVTDRSRIIAALHEPRMTAVQIRHEVAAPDPYRNHWSWNVLPAAIVVMLLGGDRNREQAELLSRAKLAAPYDTSRITLGMTPERIAALFGKPLRTWRLGGTETGAIYGAQQYISESSYWNASRFAVIYEDGKVHTVLADSFYDNRWCQNPEAASPSKTEEEHR